MMCNKWTFVWVFLLLSCGRITEDKVVVQKVFKNAAVVSAHPLATQIGKNTLLAGGNAFDAAISVQFALAVVYPIAGNIGGGGFAVILDSTGESICLDFREKAPISANSTMYLDSLGNVIENLSTEGALSAGVPGTVKGMWELHKKYGKTSWENLIQPSITLALNGWGLTEKEADYFNEFSQQIDTTSGHKTFFTQKTKYKAGDTVLNSSLGETLEFIRDLGADGFYKGVTAGRIITCMEENGGIITNEDLLNYNIVWRKPVEAKYKEFEIISMPPPSSGGIALVSMLKMYEQNKEDYDRWDPEFIHLVAEIEKRVFADRSEYLGDPDFYNVPVGNLLDDSYIKSRYSQINMNKAIPSSEIKPGLAIQNESEETTHFSIVDNDGNAIAVTTTLNGAFGSKLVVRGTGFLLNNEMDDFSIKQGYPNMYGLIGGKANSIEGGKRMLSSMTPTIVTKDKKPVLVIGSPGGSTIITSVFQNILNVIEFNVPIQQSVNLPRFHHQWLPDTLYYENDFFEFADSIELLPFGQNLKNCYQIGRVDAIYVNEKGFLECGADPRGDDFADGF